MNLVRFIPYTCYIISVLVLIIICLNAFKHMKNQDNNSMLSNKMGRNDMYGDNPIDCSVSLSPRHTHPLIALASYPGSGNTWTRHLIQQATGIYTGSVYNEPYLYKHGFVGELEDPTIGTTLTVKTHNSMSEEFDAAILLLRDPHKAIPAYFQFKHCTEDRHTCVLDETSVDQKEWVRFVDTEIEVWANHIESWLNFQKPLLVVKYSDLKRNAEKETQRIVDFLGLPVRDNRRFLCLESNVDGKQKRNSTTTEKNSVFSFSQKIEEKIDIFITSANEMLKQRNIMELELGI